MLTPAKEQQQFRRLDQLANRSAVKLFDLSPNDVLVQVALPLVLILAIATRLLMVGQSIMAQSNPALMDAWKQQLILRIDKVMEQWEKQSEFVTFPDFNRIQSKNDWPDDARFQTLCREGSALADMDGLQRSLYRRALEFRPGALTVSQSSAVAYGLEIIDPVFTPHAPASVGASTPRFIIDDEKRSYAFNYIDQRCQQWKLHLEYLQWRVVGQIAAALPPDDAISDGDLARHMRKLSAALGLRGYPLLPAVSQEYGKDSSLNTEHRILE